MNPTTYILKRKLTTLLLIATSVAAFATLGDGGSKKTSLKNRTFLSSRPIYSYKTFSLKTGYNYRGKTVFSAPKTEGKYIQLNNVVTYQKGNATYILPMKKKFTDKVKFTPLPPR